jgi:hypothetical protein
MQFLKNILDASLVESVDSESKNMEGQLCVFIKSSFNSYSILKNPEEIDFATQK